MRKLQKRVLLIGWDAADWKMIHPLLDAGKMPTLERFLNSGVMGNLATLQPILSPMLWTSIATGKRAYKHGIYGFTEPDPVSGGIRPVTNLSRKTKALWNIANQNGLHSITVGWWPSHPTEPLSRGVMVSNHYQRANGPMDKWPVMTGSVHPPRLTETLKALRFHPNELGQEEILAFLPALARMNQNELDEVVKDPRLKSLVKIIADCTTVQSAVTALMQNEPWNLTSVYFDAIDHFGHGFMKYHPPRQPQINGRDFEIYKDVVESGYRYHDMLLGALLTLAGDDTLVMIVSDHGFHPDHLRPRNIPIEPAGPAAEHRPFGIFAARGPGLKRDTTIYGASLLDICPTILHYFGLPVGEDMDGKILLDIYEQPTEVKRIPSWDLVDGDAGLHPAERQISPIEAKEALDQLVALGYIDAPGEDRAKSLDQTVRELDYNLAQSWLDGGYSAEAAEILARLYARWPTEYRFGIKLSQCYRNLKRTDDVRRIVAEIKERRLEDAQKAQAEIKKQGLDTAEGIATYQAGISNLPDAQQQRKNREATNLLARARPNLTALNFLEASADLSDGHLDAALARLAQIEGPAAGPDGTKRPLPINAVLLRGEIHLRRRDWQGAMADYELVNAADDEHPVARLGMARAYMGLKRFEAAARWALSSIALLFHQPWAHYLHGIALLRGGHWQEAEQVLLLTARFQIMAPAAYRVLARIAHCHHEDTMLSEQYRLDFLVARKRNLDMRVRAKSRPDTSTAETEAELPPFPNLTAACNTTPDEAPVPENEVITLVSGLPRSGTSLMMQMLEVAGIAPFTDEKRTADDSNPHGYYEHERVAGLPQATDFNWLAGARGKALKVVTPLLPFLPARVKGHPVHYRVIFMQRPMQEILASQGTMLRRLGKDTACTDITRAYRQQTLAAYAWMQKQNTPGLAIDYGALVAEPDTHAARTADFINQVAAADAMAMSVDPSLYRTRMLGNPDTHYNT